MNILQVKFMTPTIKILPESLASKIAAGEVVQRHASAAKELIENSIDAHAKSITVIIKDAGKTLIHIIDDGDGMTPEDTKVVFHRHATSKIATYEDLEKIITLGFRGEALASIAAVSQVELRTKLHSSVVGTKIRIDGGAVIEHVEDATAAGTSIQIRNLFFNTPGRRNFLKSSATEYKHIFDVVQRIALSHPKLNLKFISDDEKILDLQSSGITDRFAEIFGEKVAGSMIHFEETNELMSISGFIGKPDYSRKGRSEQFLYLNKRYIISRNLNHAVYQAYEHLIEKGSFPVFVLFISIDPRKVDVNVHPSKMEVKFENEGSVYRMIFSAVRKALSANDLIPSAGLREENILNTNGVTHQYSHNDPSFNSKSWNNPLHQSELSHLPFQQPFKSDSIYSDRMAKPFDVGANSEPPSTDYENKPSVAGIFNLWQIHNKYIIGTTEFGMMIIDQHAAHERVLYEKVIERFTQAKINSQQLLFPHTIEMPGGDIALLKELLPHLEKIGFCLKLFGNTTVILEGVPMDIKPGDEGKILQDVLDLYKEDDQNIKIEVKERLAKSFACKAAVKAGDPLSLSEMNALMNQLFATRIPYVCPHGRPVIIKYSLAELDKRFGRTS
jgi:DNA mismatch repair protein MutL